MRLVRPLVLRRTVIAAVCCALCLLLNACPHHIEEMVEKMAPPKGYKPSYTTSNTSLKKLTEQAKIPSRSAANATTASSPSPSPSDFDPSVLASFPYAGDIGKVLAPSVTSSSLGSGSLGSMDSSAFVGGLPQGIPKGFSSGMPDITSAMKGFLGDSALSKTLTSGDMDSVLSKLKGFSSGGAMSSGGAGIAGSMEKFMKDSSFAKMLKNIPDVIPEEMLNNLPDMISSVMGDSSATPAKSDGKEKSEQKGKSSKSSAPKESKNSAKKSEEKLGDVVPEQVAGDMARKMAQMLPQLSEMKKNYERMQREYAEREAQTQYERIAEAEEREAKRIAAEPTIMPINVHVRSINDARYPNEIELNVSVIDTAGRFISGLAPPNFQGTGNYRAYWRALADSCPQMNSTAQTRVRSFDVQEVREGSLDTHAVAFVLDHSSSMGNTRARRLQEAVARTMGIVKKQDYITAIKFTNKIKIEVPLTNDSNAYRDGFLIDGLEGYSGGTAIYDGVMAAIKELQKAPKGASKVIILFTDGDDNSSKLKIGAVYKAAKENNVRIYSIAYGMTEETPLQNLAQYTGGMMYRLYSVKEFPLAFADLYKALKNYYRIRYRPPECAAVHSVQVRLAVPELVTVSTGTAQYDRSVFTPLDTVGSVQLVNIEFETGKATIRAESLSLLRDVAQYLKRSPRIVMEVRGHTDNRGGTEINQKLSEARAQAVATALIGMGVQKTQLRIVGYGESKPLAANDTEENRRRNRRTEFAIVEK
ncbi:MAG: OmpA family protein [Candidatus Kapabacteria bacterium]|nr:OmpA family protein [Candidatus Kapabacteria bacterium]